jgi:hypothetical protein
MIFFKWIIKTMSCKDELKSLAKVQLSDQQAQILEGVFQSIPESERNWFGCLVADGLKKQSQWYNTALVGALVAFVIAGGIAFGTRKSQS